MDEGRAFVERYGWTWPSIQDPERKRARSLGATYQPHVVLVDGDGRIVASHEGRGDAEIWAALVAQLPEARPRARLVAMTASSASAYPECVPATWLGERLAVEPARIEAMRRAGELIAVRAPGTTDWLYPAWQFVGPLPRRDLPRVVAAARAAGVADERLYEILTAPLGMTRGDGPRRLVDLLAEGRVDDVVAAVRTA